MKDIRFRGRDEETNELILEIEKIDFTDGYFYYRNDHDEWQRGKIETLEAFTGLHDKNNKPIYEHDILKDGKGGLGLVIYSSVNAAFVVKADGKEWWLNEGDMSRGNTLEYTEIVGALHTTPELLKEK